MPMEQGILVIHRTFRTLDRRQAASGHSGQVPESPVLRAGRGGVVLRAVAGRSAEALHGEAVRGAVGPVAQVAVAPQGAGRSELAVFRVFGAAGDGCARADR